MSDVVLMVPSLISIFITFKYVDNYDRLYYQIEKKRLIIHSIITRAY